MRETLVLQELLRQLKDSAVRDDFLTGSNGAAKLEQTDMALIDKLLEEGFVAMEGAESVETFETHAHRAADHWVSTVDGKPKQFVGGVTYEHVKRIVRTVQDCGYFDRCFVNAPTTKLPLTHNSSPVDEETETTTSNAEGESTGTPSMVDGSEGAGGGVGSSSSGQPLPNEGTPAAQPTTTTSNPIPVLQGVPFAGNNGGGMVGQPQLPVIAPATEVYFNGFPQPPQPLLDPNSLPEELETGAFSFLQESELDELGNPASAVPAAAVGVPPANSHPSPVPTVIPPQQQPQPPSSLMLINSMVPMTYPMGPQSIVPPVVNHAAPVAAAAVGSSSTPAQSGHLNPVQQLVKTLNAANYHHLMQHQQQMAPVEQQQQQVVSVQPNLPMPQQQSMMGGNMMLNMNGVGGVPPRMAPSSVNPANAPATAAPSAGPTGYEAEVAQKQLAPGVTERTSPLAMPNGAAPAVEQQVTISEWKNEDAARTEDKLTDNRHQKREASAESSSGDRRREDRRPRQNGDRGSSSWNGGAGGNDTNNGGYNASRRRFYDRPNGGGGGGGGTFNGSRMHHRGSGGGGPAGVTEGENGTSGNSSASSSFRTGGGGKPHFNSGRMNGAGGGGGGSNGHSGGYNNGSGGGNKFYRNNDPTYYQQNGGTGKPARQSNGMGSAPTAAAGNWKAKGPHCNGSGGENHRQQQPGYSQTQQAVGGAGTADRN